MVVEREGGEVDCWVGEKCMFVWWAGGQGSCETQAMESVVSLRVLCELRRNHKAVASGSGVLDGNHTTLLLLPPSLRLHRPNPQSDHCSRQAHNTPHMQEKG